MKISLRGNWQDTLQYLQDELVPMSGECETIQGELVRCINNLSDEGFRNGWINWDVGDEESIEVLRRYLGDSGVFSAPTREKIDKALDAICHAGERGADEGFFAYDELAFIAEHVVAWCCHHDELLFKRPEATWLDESPFR